ncbi:MAG: hypothetical protein ACI4L5_01330 [Negativibacillus sp.]
MARNGGIKSGISRRRKRSLREAADLYLSLPVSDKKRFNKIARKLVDPEDIDNQMAMIIGLTEAATMGDARAARVIVELIGEDAKADDTARENNLLEAIRQSGEVNADDIPEAE